MNLYLVSQNVNNEYDTYDSAVVCAETIAKARLTHPSGKEARNGKEKFLDSWCAAEYVEVKFLGKACATAVASVVCASYNSG